MTPRAPRPPALTDRARALAEVKAGKAAAKFHAFDKAAEIAERVKDATALEKALIGKLEAQRDFAARYMALFPHGVRADYSRSDSSVRSGDDWCLTHGMHVRTVRRWCDLVDGATYVEQKNAIFKKCWTVAEMGQAANFSSESIEWYTPARYIEAAREVLGEIDLDPASSAQANAVVRASKFFSKEDDGLARDWFGRVFMNSPYGRTADGRSLAAAFCNKAIDEFAAGNVEACIILVNSLHSQSWQAPLYDYPFCLVDHRIQFVSADGEENKNPTFQNIFVYLGNDVLKFAKVFSRFGYVAKKIGDKAPHAPAPDAASRGAR
jgi:DNA N-6-adenine-methyltransferase (Dam)